MNSINPTLIHELTTSVEALLEQYTLQKELVATLQQENKQLRQVLTGKIPLGKRGGQLLSLQTCIATLDQCLSYLERSTHAATHVDTKH